MVTNDIYSIFYLLYYINFMVSFFHLIIPMLS